MKMDGLHFIILLRGAMKQLSSRFWKLQYVNVNVVKRQHENALHLAVREDNVSMVKILATNQQLQVT